MIAINRNLDSSAYLMVASDITKIRNKYEKTLIDLIVKLFCTLEKVNRKQLINANKGIKKGFTNLL